MPVLRLFAAAREAAGTSTDEVPGETVDAVLAAARARYGPGFAEILASSRVWHNGAPATGPGLVAPTDEIAILPPVSGGSGDGGRSEGQVPGYPPGPVARGGSAASTRFQPRPAGPRPRPSGLSRARDAPLSVPTGTPRPAGSGPPQARAIPTAAPRRPPSARRSTPTRNPAPGPVDPIPVPTRRPDRGPAVRRQAAPDRAREPSPRRSPSPGPPHRPAQSAGATPPARPVDVSLLSGLSRSRTTVVPGARQVRVRGKDRPVSGVGPRRNALARRYAAVYDTTGPRVTLGVAWFALAVAALVLGRAPLAFVYAVAAGWAGLEVARRQQEVRTAVDPWLAALAAGAVGASALGGTRMLGATVLAAVVVAVGSSVLGPRRGAPPLAAAGASLLCALPFGLAAAGVVLTRELEIGAAVVLVLLVSAYEAGDFLIGSGSSNSLEGPVTGMVTVGVTAMVMAALQVPPFDGAPVFTFAALAAVACPLGQVATSALLPAADARAPAARRLDSLLVLAPVWAWAVGLYVASLP